MKLAAERRDAIVAIVRDEGAVSIAQLVERWGVPAVTLRRDVRALADAGYVEKVHGGAARIGSTGARLERTAAGGRASSGAGSPPRAPADTSPGALSTGPDGGSLQGVTVGLVLPSTAGPYRSVLRGARHAAADLGLRLELAVSHFAHAADRDLTDRLVASGVDAVCVAASGPLDDAPALAERLTTRPVPVVLVETDPTDSPAEQLDAVRTDHATGAALAVRHLHGEGHHDVALAVANGPAAPALVRGYTSTLRRLASAGAPAVHVLPDPRISPRGHRDVADHLLASVHDGMTALLVHDDQHALEIVARAVARGLVVPDDLAVVSSGDDDADLAAVPLTAVAHPGEDVGRVAVETAAWRLADGTRTAPRHLALVPQLVVRESSAARPLP